MSKDLKTGREGALETSWLNSRAKDSVGKGMEGELWERARRLVERIEQGREQGNDGSAGDMDTSMTLSHESNG